MTASSSRWLRGCALGVLVACSPPAYGPPSDSTVIILHTTRGGQETNLAIFGTRVRYAAGRHPLTSETGAIARDDVASIIAALEVYDFLDRRPEPRRGGDGTATTITVRLTGGEHTVTYGSDSELMPLGDRIRELSGFSTWLELR